MEIKTMLNPVDKVIPLISNLFR